MWNVADGTLGSRDLKIPAKPLWRIPALPTETSGDMYVLPGGVFPSLFSIDVIEAFLRGFANEPWFENVEEIVLGRQAGTDLFNLRFVHEGQEFTILIQQDKYGWRDLNVALSYILKRLQEEGGNHLIDATYEGKIVVRSLSSAAGEGSSK
jgi:hypothetical protein